MIKELNDKPELLRFTPAIRRPFAPALPRYVLMNVILAQCPYALTNKFVTRMAARQGLIAQMINDSGGNPAEPDF